MERATNEVDPVSKWLYDSEVLPHMYCVGISRPESADKRVHSASVSLHTLSNELFCYDNAVENNARDL